MSERFVWKNKVYFGDTDAAGIVYHGRYVYWMEAARIDFLEYLGCPYTQFQERSIGFIPKSVQLDFEAPMTFSDQFSVEVSITSLSRASIDILSIFKIDDQIKAVGTVKLACVNESKWKPMALPEEFVRVVQPYIFPKT